MLKNLMKDEVNVFIGRTTEIKCGDSKARALISQRLGCDLSKVEFKSLRRTGIIL
jgi:hypothetical protein